MATAYSGAAEFPFAAGNKPGSSRIMVKDSGEFFPIIRLVALGFR